MQGHWESTKRCKSEGMTLILVTLKTFLAHFMKLLVLLLVVVGLFCCTPYLTSSNIDYIQHHAGDL